MKSILIPTVLENDTLYAIETAIEHAKGKSCTIVLLTLTETPDTGSAAAFLRKTRRPLTPAQSELLNECYNAVALTHNCRLEVHHQYGLSAALLRNLLQYLETDMVILSPSYKAEKKRIHTYFCKLVGTCKKPILHLGSGCGRPAFNKALYIKTNNVQIDLKELQQLVNRQFDFKIVSQASVVEGGHEGFAPFVNEAIEKNGIDLLIETRKSKKTLPEKAMANDALGLPVLSIHEEAARYTI